MKTAIALCLLFTACSYECPVHSHGVDLTDGGGFACEADECWEPSGELAAQGFVPNPQDPCWPRVSAP